LKNAPGNKHVVTKGIPYQPSKRQPAGASKNTLALALQAPC
jgi:hypothetical protein